MFDKHLKELESLVKVKSIVLKTVGFFGTDKSRVFMMDRAYGYTITEVSTDADFEELRQAGEGFTLLATIYVEGPVDSWVRSCPRKDCLTHRDDGKATWHTRDCVVVKDEKIGVFATTAAAAAKRLVDYLKGRDDLHLEEEAS